MILKPLFDQYWHKTELDSINELAGVPAEESHRNHYKVNEYNIPTPQFSCYIPATPVSNLAPSHPSQAQSSPPQSTTNKSLAQEPDNTNAAKTTRVICHDTKLSQPLSALDFPYMGQTPPKPDLFTLFRTSLLPRNTDQARLDAVRGS